MSRRIGEWKFLFFLLLVASSMRFNRFVFSSVCPGRLNTKHLFTVIHHISFSDWVFLYYLAKNLEPFVFSDLLADLSTEFRQNYVDDRETMRLADRETMKADEIGEKSAINKESIDEVDFRRKWIRVLIWHCSSQSHLKFKEKKNTHNFTINHLKRIYMCFPFQNHRFDLLGIKNLRVIHNDRSFTGRKLVVSLLKRRRIVLWMTSSNVVYEVRKLCGKPVFA